MRSAGGRRQTITQGAGFFVFHSADDAARYVRAAASGRCRKDAVAYLLAQPAGARALAWNNPLGVSQADVFFVRGNVVYRLIDVSPDDLGRRELVRVSQWLACQMRDAKCEPRPGAWSAA